MEVIKEYAILLLALFAVNLVLAVFAAMAKRPLPFVLGEGIVSLFTLCFLIFNSASLEEMLLCLCLLVLPSTFRGRRKHE